MNYAEKLANPLWQKKRLEIFNRDNWKCQECGKTDEQLEIHHVEYFEGREPWEYDNNSLVTVCHSCHQKENIRFKYEKYLLQSLKMAGFLATDILIMSAALGSKKVAQKVKNMVRKTEQKTFREIHNVIK